jgi:hypothetical protein
VPLFLAVAIAGIAIIRMGYAIAWGQLLVPSGMFVGIQIGFYMGAFWAGKWARQRGRYWPISLLAGFYLWGTGLMIMHYGVRWGILPSFGDSFGFSICMALVTVIASFLAVKFGHKIANGSLQQNK